MADPLYIWIGDTADVGATYDATAGSTAPQDATGNRAYDFGARIDGVDGAMRFTGAPDSDAWAPRVWNHDDIHDGSNSIVSISAASPSVILCSQPHGRSAGETVEIHVDGVGGADAASINGTWTATAVSTHSFSIPLDATALTLVAISATVAQPGWSYSLPSAESSRSITSDTDRSLGGSIGSAEDGTDIRRWGADVSMLADLHDRLGALESQPRYLAVGIDAGMLTREPVSVTNATAGTATTLTVSASTLLADPLRDQTVVLWGFSGDYAAVNGEHTAHYVSATTIKLPDVATVSAEAYTGGGMIAMRPRWHHTFGSEAFNDFTARLGDAIGAATDDGDTLTCKGVVLGLGYREQSSFADDDAETVTGLRIASISTDGFPTTVTLTDAHTFDEDAVSTHLRIVRLYNCGDLSGLHEARVIDETTLVLHTSNAVAIDTTSSTLDIGDPSWFFAEELPGFIAAVRSAVATETGDTAADIPVLPVQPRVLAGCTDPWDGTSAFSTCAAYRRIKNAIDAVHAPVSGVSVIQTSMLALQAASNREMTTGAALDLGHLVADELALQETPTTAYGSATGRGAPVYVIVGDDYGHGGPVSYLTAYYDGNQDYDGTQWFGRGINIFDHRLTDFAEYTGVDRSTGSAQPGNANTHPSWNLNPGNLEGGPASIVGSEQSLVLRLRDRHDQPVYICKLAVNGSALTESSRSLRIVGHESVEVEDGDDPVADITTSIPHGRYDYTASFHVVVSGMDDTSIPDGTYTAIPQSPTVLRITLTTPSSGGLPIGGASVSVPRPSWVKADADIWASMTAMRTAAFNAIRADGYEPDVRGVFVPGLGLNDALFGTTADYQAALVQFFDDIRDAWTTRSQPNAALPIVLGKVRSSDDYAGGATTTAFVDAVRTAQSTVTAADAAATLVETNTFGFNSDDQSLTWDGLIDLGTALNTAFDDVDQSCSAVEGSHTYTVSSDDFVS